MDPHKKQPITLQPLALYTTTTTIEPAPQYQTFEQVAPVANMAIGSADGQWLLRRAASTDKRLILDFFPTAVTCTKPVVLHDDLFTQCPPQVQARGISNDEWINWMEKFRTVVEKNSLSCCSGFWLCLSVVGIPFVYRYGIKLQLEMKKFSEEINMGLFEPRGMFWKTQTSSVQVSDDYHEQTSWIAIALTPDESQILKAEEHILYQGCNGMHEPCPCCTKCTSCMCCCCIDVQF
jgi:hypothetical protein